MRGRPRGQARGAPRDDDELVVDGLVGGLAVQAGAAMLTEHADRFEPRQLERLQDLVPL